MGGDDWGGWVGGEILNIFHLFHFICLEGGICWYF